MHCIKIFVFTSKKNGFVGFCKFYYGSILFGAAIFCRNRIHNWVTKILCRAACRTYAYSRMRNGWLLMQIHLFLHPK